MFSVLLAVDFHEERARRAAECVCSLPNAAEAVHVTILNVQKKFEVADEIGQVSSEEWYDEEDVPASVDVARDVLEEAGISFEVRRQHARPAKSIVETAEEIDADRIVMARRKQTPMGKVLFGSVTQAVLLNSSVPVTTVNA
jgi:nucleotide-binding universal stress UspA family protein